MADDGPCIICFESVTKTYDPALRPAICSCKYTIHKPCYDEWLRQTSTAYNCVICHTRLDIIVPATAPAPVPANQHHPEAHVVTLIFDTSILKLLLLTLLLYIYYSQI